MLSKLNQKWRKLKTMHFKSSIQDTDIIFPPWMLHNWKITQDKHSVNIFLSRSNSWIFIGNLRLLYFVINLTEIWRRMFLTEKQSTSRINENLRQRVKQDNSWKPRYPPEKLNIIPRREKTFKHSFAYRYLGPPRTFRHQN